MNIHNLIENLEQALAELPVLDAHTHLVGGKLGARGLHLSLRERTCSGGCATSETTRPDRLHTRESITMEDQVRAGKSQQPVPDNPHRSGVGRAQTYAVHSHQVITDQRFEELLEDGFLILPSFIPQDELPALQAAQRRCLKPWDEVKDNPPAGRAVAIAYPYPEVLMSRLYLHPELLKLARRFLKTEQIHSRVRLKTTWSVVCINIGQRLNGRVKI